MGMVKVDIVTVIKFDCDSAANTCIYTNAKPEALEEIFDAWIQDQIGAGADESQLVPRPVYTIKLGLIMEDDSFCTESDTGNKGLTAGIMMEVYRMLKDIPVKDLKELPA